MIFITNDNIIELSNWGLQGIQIFSGTITFYEILNPLFSINNDDGKYTSIKEEIKNQIMAHPWYVDLRKMQIGADSPEET